MKGKFSLIFFIIFAFFSEKEIVLAHGENAITVSERGYLTFMYIAIAIASVLVLVLIRIGYINRQLKEIKEKGELFEKKLNQKRFLVLFAVMLIIGLLSSIFFYIVIAQFASHH